MALTALNSTEELTPSLRQQLLGVARESIRQGFDGEILVVRAADYPEPLRVPRATFVTLHVDGVLHGCIGTLEAWRPLVEDVASNAYGAAFQDFRFPALTLPEFKHLDVHISILNPSEPMNFSSEGDLIAQLRPGIDGLILEEGHRRGTFLPSVWESVPDARDFVRQLKLKAGLAPDYWSKNLRIQRYTTASIP